MRLALAIASLFPSGGLQRDCLAIARILKQRGHDVTIITADYRRPVELDGVPLRVWPSWGLTSAGRDIRFGKRLAAAAANDFDRVIGFSKIPGIDIYYCADPPILEIRTGLLHSLSPRVRAQQLLERRLFGRESRTSILVLAERQLETYHAAWGTPLSRFRVVPPTLDPRRRQPELRTTARTRIRRSLDLGDEVPVWLAVTSAPRTKGTDRIVAALADAPQTMLLVAGVLPGSRAAHWLEKLAGWAGVRNRIRFLGHREDIPELMAAADVLVHPARRETTGTAILEAVVNGLPAIVTDLCGYAIHVARADAGILLPTPFRDDELANALAIAADPDKRALWSRHGAAYGASPSLSSGHAWAAEAMVGPLWASPADHGPADSRNEPASRRVARKGPRR